MVTFYTVFVIDLASRRVQIVGSTPHPDEGFMRQVGRTLTAADEGVLVGHRVLICDRDAKWSAPVRERLGEAGIRVVQTPFQAPNANAYAERFVRSIKDECLNRVIPFGERHLRRTIAEYVEHYHRERNHQGLENELIEGATRGGPSRPHSPTSAARRTPQLLLSRGVMSRDGSIRWLGSTMGHYGLKSSYSASGALRFVPNSHATPCPRCRAHHRSSEDQQLPKSVVGVSTAAATTGSESSRARACRVLLSRFAVGETIV